MTEQRHPKIIKQAEQCGNADHGTIHCFSPIEKHKEEKFLKSRRIGKNILYSQMLRMFRISFTWQCHMQPTRMKNCERVFF